MSGESPTTTERRCPKCGSESVAWVTTSTPGLAKSPTGQPMTSQQFECRKCSLPFNYFMAEDRGEGHSSEGHERRGRIGGRLSKAGIVEGQEVLVQGAIGRRDGGDARHAERIDEAILAGAVEAFTAAPGLLRVGGDVVEAEAGQGTADLRERVAAHGLPAFGV